MSCWPLVRTGRSGFARPSNDRTLVVGVHGVVNSMSVELGEREFRRALDEFR